MVCILNFKTTWSEFQRASQTAAERGEAELRILNSKTTWSEFQMPSQTAPAEVKPRYVYSILKPHGQSSRSPVRPLLSEATPSYVYSILKPHGQSSRGSTYIHFLCQSQAVVCVSIPRTNLQSKYFLYIKIVEFLEKSFYI